MPLPSMPAGRAEDRSFGDLSGTLAVVVGASQGIGRAIALGLTQAGSAVVVAGRDSSRLTEAFAGEGVPSIAGYEEVDVSDVASITSFAERVVRKYGCPTILVNSAGFSVTKNAFEITPDDWNNVHDVQLRGPFFSCQAFARPMAEQGYGKIINISSTWAVSTSPGRSAYCAAKAGLGHLTAALATEWAPIGIRVNAIAPTATLTPTVAKRFEVDPDREEYLRKGIPLGRLAVPADVVGAAVFLASPDSDFVTGHTLFVDGGWRTSK